MDNDEGLWSDEINAFVDAAFESGIVSRNPSDAEQHTAYRYAIKLAMDEGRQAQTDAFALLEKYSYWIPAEEWKAIYDMRAKRQPQTDVFEAAKRDWEAIEEDDAESVLVDWALKHGDALLSATLRRPQTDAIKIAAEALIADVRRRYPNEKLRCKYMIALDAALEQNK